MVKADLFIWSGYGWCYRPIYYWGKVLFSPSLESVASYSFLPFEGAYLFSSIVCRFTKFWNIALGIKIRPNDWLFNFGQVPFHIFLQFLPLPVVAFACCQQHGRKAACSLNSTAWEGFWRWKTKMSCVSALQYFCFVVVNHSFPRGKC